MKGIVKLKVPVITVTPRLFVITLSKDSVQRKFAKVDLSLDQAVKQCWYNGHQYTMANYITHFEMSVTDINNLFKSFNP